jgi:hypothetical protein
MTAEIHDTVKTAEQLAQTYQQSGTVLNETIGRYHELLRYQNSQPPSGPSELPRILASLTRVAQELNHLAGPPETRSAPAARAALQGVVEDMLDALLWRLMALTAAVLSLLLLYRYLIRRFLTQPASAVTTAAIVSPVVDETEVPR